MAKFKIEWVESGEVEYVNQSDVSDVDGYINTRFGAAFDPKKAKVTLVADKEVAPHHAGHQPAKEAPKSTAHKAEPKAAATKPVSDKK